MKKRKTNKGGSTKKATPFFDTKPRRDIFNTKQVKDFLKEESKGTTRKYQKKLKESIESLAVNPRHSTKDIINLTRREYKYKRDFRLSPVLQKGKQRKDREGKKLWKDERSGKIIKGKEVQKLIRKSIVVKLESFVSQQKNVSITKAKQMINKQRKKKKWFQIFKMYYQ